MGVLWAGNAIPPFTNAASLSRRLSASTPPEQFLVYTFDAAIVQTLDYRLMLPQSYDGGGLSCYHWWGASTATTGNVVWELAFRAITDDAEDVDVAHTYDFNTVTDTCPSASGEFTAAVITFTDGADMDNVVPGIPAVLRLRRKADDVAGDTMSGFAEALVIEIRET
jgi:hypothetical protein